jgi:hypothetical protein
VQTTVCKDVSQEFCTQALSLLVMFYEGRSAESITPFPAVKKRELPPPETPIPFNSAVADLRLRRAYEPRIEAQIARSEQLAARAEEISQVLRSSQVNLDAVFLPEPGLRIVKSSENDSPQNLERDFVGRKATRKPLQSVSTQETLERIRTGTDTGKSRAKRRIQATERSGSGIHKISPKATRIDGDLTKEHRMAAVRESIRRNYKSPTIKAGN